MTNSPLVSVIIPCYNHAHYLAEAIKSVLEQQYPHFEILVVDDGSSDNTRDVAKLYPTVNYIWQDNQGLAAARNTGIRYSQGQYLVFLDADDWLHANALKTGVHWFSIYPDCAFVSGSYRMVDASRNPLGNPVLNYDRPDPYAALLRGNFIGMHATVMYCRSVLDEMNGFDTSLPACEDYDLYLRVARKHQVFCYQEVVADYRQHNTNMSRNALLMLKKALAVHQKQWPYVQQRADYVQAYYAGRAFLKAFYGSKYFGIIRAESHSFYKSSQVYRSVFSFIRIAPDVFFNRLLEKITYSLVTKHSALPASHLHPHSSAALYPGVLAVGNERELPKELSV